MTADQELHKLGEVLRTAREAKGVDLARVERDTKIRTRYLSALESADYRELPGSVYTKGFLRNYGAYLGLDAEYLIDLYRLESAGVTPERLTVPTPPRPIATRRRGFVLTPGALVAALLTVGVGIFVVYLVSEFVTFARTPELRITDPATDVAGYQGTAYTIRGITEPNSRVTVSGLPENPTVTADAKGAFEVRVELLPGPNLVTLVASDPLTGRDSAEVHRTIEVGTGGPSPSAPDAMALTAPEEGATLTGPVEIAGSAAPGSVVNTTAALVSRPAASMRVVTLAGQDVPIPAASPAPPAPLMLTAGTDGAFSGSLQLAAGTWDVTITPAAAPDQAATRRVTVTLPSGLHGSLTISGGPSYLEIDEDGRPKNGVSGRVSNAGTTVPLAAQATLRIRVGNAGAVHLMLNGVDFGTMGGNGAVVEWSVTRL